MPKKRDNSMTVHIPQDQKDVLRKIAGDADVTVNDVVLRAVRDLIDAYPIRSKSKAKR
jgi:hypothetical protein